MRLHTSILTLAVSLSSLVVPSAGAQTDPGTVKAVLTAEDQRFAAMIRGDTAALRLLLADSLSYTHTDGEQQSKGQFLETLGSGTLRYDSIGPQGRGVRVVGDVAVVTGRSAMRLKAQGQVRAFAIRYLAVYQHRGGGWQLLAWQSTRLP